MGAVVLLAFMAAFNPTLIAATTVMLVLPSPERLMLAYWLGATLTGVASGLVIVFALKDTAAEHTTRHTVSPIVQLECPRGRGHLIAWVCPTRLEGCGVHAKDASAVSRGVSS